MSQITAAETPSTTAFSSDSAMTQSPTGNGFRADAESSKMAVEGLQDSTGLTQHAVGLADFIFNVGYLGQNWADIHLTFFDTGVKLHRIVLARSPFLLRHMVGDITGNVHLVFDDDSITVESVHIALQHLYRPSQHLVNPFNSRPVLATSLLFDGMSELVQHAYEVTRGSLEADNVIEIVQWASRPAAPVPHVNGAHGAARQEEGERYGEWSARLKADVNAFLVQTLPKEADDAQLVSAYSRLPFDLFKQCVESDELPIDSTQQRFAFAKKVIASRKKAAAAGQMDEAAVLAMQGNGMSVVVTRRAKKGRSLFKVEG